MLRPLKEFVLVRQTPAKETVGGIIIPQSSKGLYDDIGTVEAVGAEVEDVKVGDRVLFKRTPGAHLGEDNKEWENLLMMKIENILAVVTDA